MRLKSSPQNEPINNLPMKIAHIDLGDRPVMLAPMEDVTDRSFRLICKELGADMTYSEFVSADALIRNIAATTRKLQDRKSTRLNSSHQD